MSESYIGEIRLFAGNKAPANWEFCWGQQMSISNNNELYALLGTTWGGDGRSYFNLPDLRGRVMVGSGTATSGTTYTVGQAGGSETVTLTEAQVPTHTHQLVGTTDLGTSRSPSAMTWATALTNAYAAGTSNAEMASTALSPYDGGSQPHDNVQPYIALNYIIAIKGDWPFPSTDGAPMDAGRNPNG